ncbi:hypothetical protein ACF05T_13575 [Streptomyces lateritius]|uniref:Uncharacterized protein n=1 Tax=Streptomyces lateritius TaxID=67313 RepID=A0ABW6YBB7_9ACTN
MINTNALACDLRKTVNQSVRDHEVSLLLSNIIGGQGKGPLESSAPPSTPAQATSSASSASAPGLA